MFVEFSKVISKPNSSVWTCDWFSERYTYVSVSMIIPNTFLLSHTIFDTYNAKSMRKRLTQTDRVSTSFLLNKLQPTNCWCWISLCLSFISYINTLMDLPIVDMLFKRNLVESVYAFSTQLSNMYISLQPGFFTHYSYHITIIIFSHISRYTRLTRLYDSRIIESIDCRTPMKV